MLNITLNVEFFSLRDNKEKLISRRRRKFIIWLQTETMPLEIKALFSLRVVKDNYLIL